MSNSLPPMMPGWIPEAEMDATWRLYAAIGEFARLVPRFAHALDLFEMAGVEMQKTQDMDLLKRYGDWRFLAARDCVMTVYHFSCGLSVIKNMKGCDSLQCAVKTDALRLATRKFEAQFPNYEAFRHALAHSFESLAPSQIQKHVLTADYASPNFVFGSGSIFRESLDGDTFTTGYEGKALSLRIARETCDDLSAIADEVFACFPDWQAPPP